MEKTGLIFVIHNHQPAGNFDDVMRRAHDDCYLPFVEALERHPSIRAGLHYTGSLLEWMEQNTPATIERIAQLAASGRAEIIGGGWQEPMLGILPLRDAVGQLRMMKRECSRLFGTVPTGMWLAERVWEPELAQIISQAGYRYTFLDDTHFRYSGILQDMITGYYTTEKGGHTLSIFPISKVLRYAIPFKEPDRALEALAHRPGNVWTYGDDGEKFGLWPGTKKRVWDEGWMERFLSRIEQEVQNNTLDCILPSQVIEKTPAEGKIYLPTCSYHEMGEWSLPAEAAGKLHDFVQSLEKSGLKEMGSPFVRGGTWSNFLTKYDESNLMHKKMMLVSRKVAEKERSDRAKMDAPSGETLAARRALYRGQTNCPYWHGLFGGLYLPHLRKAVYKNLLEAERLVDPLTGDIRVSTLDFDLDGLEEILVEGEKLNVLVKPSRGASATEIDLRETGINLVDVLRRRKEAYHKDMLNKPAREEAGRDGSLSAEELQRFPTREIKKKLRTDSAGRHAFHEFILNKESRLGDLSISEDIEQNRLLADCRNKQYRINKTTTDNRTAIIEASLLQEIYSRTLEIEKTFFINTEKARLALHYTLKWNGEEPFEGIFVVEINFSLPQFLPPDNIWIVEKPGKELAAEERGLDSRGVLEDISKISCRGRVDPSRSARLTFQMSPGCRLARYPVSTVSQSETGFESVYQGTCLLAGWNVYLENWNEWKGRILLNMSTDLR